MNMEVFIILPLLVIVVSSQSPIVLQFSVKEELDPQVIVGNVGQKSNLSDTFTFRFITTYQNFEIDENSGILNTVRKLDRETLCPNQLLCKQHLRVTAMSGPDVKTIVIYVDILDVNDNSPSFPVTSMARSIAENLPVNTTITLVGATDPDMGVNNSIQSYEIVPALNIFALDIHPKLDGTSEVILRVLTTLDRETRDYYQLYIKAKDGGNPVKTGMLMLNITVTDVNDEKPTFTKEQYDVIINENITVNQVFLTLSATDRDIRNNGEVHYKFSSYQTDSTVFSLFDINTVTTPSGNKGEIFVKTSLTVIPEAPYRIIVEASDSGTTKVLSSQAVVTISVLDINNNDPIIGVTFVDGTDYALIPENSANGTVVAFVHVDDADQGVNRIATCSINSNFFRLETFAENEFKISVHGLLDREDRYEHVITVSCLDGGNPKRNATKSFVIQIEDENDNQPVFTDTEYKSRITENKPPFTYITKVSATDADQGNNAQVRYQLGEDVQNDFQIESNTGIIKSKRSLDREKKGFYSFFVYAVDNGVSSSRTSSVVVDVTVEDENDNYPQFSKQHYTFEITENQQIQVGRVEANDTDEMDNGVVTFHIKEDVNYVPFSVSLDGGIAATEELDREAKDQYTFEVIARDLGNLKQNSNVTTVTVNVLDINDNAPVFIFPNSTNKSVSIQYLANPDTLVTTLIAEDSDAGKNGTVTYKFISGNEDNLFYLDDYSGEIFLSRKLHIYEIKPYELTVSAEDQGSPHQQVTHELLWIHIKFVNVTTVASLTEAGAGQNIIIAIIIGCITALLSILIIITICVIRKMDSRKHIYSAKSAEHMRIVDLKRGSSNRSSSSKGSQDRIMDVYELPQKKEVSFSIDEEQENTLSMTFPSTLSSGSGMVTFKSNSSLNTQQNGHVPNHGRDDSLTDSGQQQLHRMTSLRVQQQYLQTQQNGREKWKQSQQQQRQLSPVAKSEDSDMSAVSTTDSGNGGSDEDVRNHPPESGCRPGSVSPRQHSTTDSAISRDFSATKPILSTFGHPQNGGMSTFPRNSQGKNQMFHNVRDPHYHDNYEGAKIQRLHSDNIHPHQQYIDIPRVPSGDLFHGDLQRANRNNNLTRSYEDTLSDSCVSPRDEDDRATTTSGSYTVNPDDLCTEIDELFFRDRGDTVV
ncbi:PCDHD1 [Mytilus coruscus]|uniref:PCDHD1 n=1 Tax=Mytilus coruscus TaxID=42192 RepID=A0A6J8A7I7_MYTCO|nr:PCDHD1 [Mytilus coruscus]